MRIFCHLLNDNSGSPRVLLATLDALHASEDDILYVGSQGQGVLEEADIETRRFWYRRSSYRIVTLFTLMASQIALYRSLSKAPGIANDATIFANTLLPFGAMLWGKRTGRTVVVHVHEVSITPAIFRRFLTRCAGHCADHLIYVSHDHRDRLPINGSPATIIPNPVGSKIASRATDYTPRRSGVFNVLMLASLRGYKGVGEFMVLARTLEDRNDISFTLVLNAAPDEAKAFASHHPNAVNVSVHPRTDDPVSFYQKADLVVNLSRIDQWVETFGLTLAEAMTFGIPVIAPSLGGPTELVTHGKEGYCLDSRDGGALKSAVLAIADDPDHAMSLSRAARARAADFTIDAYAKRLRDTLEIVDKEKLRS